MVNRILAVVLLTFSIASISWATPFVTEWQSHKALEQYKQGKYEDAAKLYSAASNNAKKELKSSLEYNRALAEVQSGETTTPLKVFSELYSADNPDLNSASRYNLGVCLATSESLAIETSKANAKQILEDSTIQQLANTDKSTTLSQVQNAALSQASEQVKSSIEAISQSMNSNQTIANAWREALIETPGEKDAQHNAEITFNTQKELEQYKSALEELLKKLQPPQQQNQNQDKNQQQQQQNQNNDQQDKQDKQNNDNNSNSSDSSQNNDDKNDSEKQKNDVDKQHDNQNSDNADKEKQDQNANQENKEEQNPTTDKKNDNEKQDANDGSKDSEIQKQDSNDKSQKQVKIGEMSQHDVQRLLNSLPDNNEDILGKMLNTRSNTNNDEDKDW